MDFNGTITTDCCHQELDVDSPEFINNTRILCVFCLATIVTDSACWKLFVKNHSRNKDFKREFKLLYEDCILSYLSDYDLDNRGLELKDGLWSLGKGSFRLPSLPKLDDGSSHSSLHPSAIS